MPIDKEVISKRKAGFYWVKFPEHSELTVAEYDSEDGEWYVIGNDRTFKDSDFTEIVALIESERFADDGKTMEGDKEGSTTECPTCARNSERFELPNYPPEHMCEGCGMTWGGIMGKWNKIFYTLYGRE